MHGETKLTGHGRALVKGVGACFVEIEVDTWTGQFRVTRVVYSHDTGKVINPHIVKSVGLGLDEKAIESVLKWTFRPGTLNGKPVERFEPAVTPDSPQVTAAIEAALDNKD